MESVALGTYSGMPPQSGGRSAVEIPGRDMPGDEAPIVEQIGAQYFATMKIPLIQGRVWSDSESGGTAHVAVVNQTMARGWWPNQSAIGTARSDARLRQVTQPSSGWRRPAVTAGSR